MASQRHEFGYGDLGLAWWGGHLSTFALSSVSEEIQRWSETGRSCFARWVEKLGLTDHGLPDDDRLSLLDRVIPVPDG